MSYMERVAPCFMIVYRFTYFYGPQSFKRSLSQTGACAPEGVGSPIYPYHRTFSRTSAKAVSLSRLFPSFSLGGYVYHGPEKLSIAMVPFSEITINLFLKSVNTIKKSSRAPGRNRNYRGYQNDTPCH